MTLCGVPRTKTDNRQHAERDEKLTFVVLVANKNEKKSNQS